MLDGKESGCGENMDISFFNAVKVQIKTALPWYIITMAGVFAVFLPTIFGCDTYEEIGVILDRNFSFLSIFIFCNIYYIEVQQNTEEVFYLLPDNQKKAEICRRVGLRLIFTVLLFFLSYYLFTLRDMHLSVDEVKEVIILQGFFAVISNIIFFGGISCLSVSLSQNLWKGLGSSIVIWIILGSTWAKVIPDFANVFIYGEANRNWLQGKIFGLFAGAILFWVSISFISKSPCRYKKRLKWIAKLHW